MLNYTITVLLDCGGFGEFGEKSTGVDMEQNYVNVTLCI